MRPYVPSFPERPEGARKRCHPAPGPRGSVSFNSSLSLQNLYVDYSGHPYVYLLKYSETADSVNSAHAALSPWEGRNALDAAVMAYNSISMLRQQLKRTHRIHGIFLGAQEGKSWAIGSKTLHPPVILFSLYEYDAVIPDSAKMQYVSTLIRPWSMPVSHNTDGWFAPLHYRRWKKLSNALWHALSTQPS